MCLFYNENNEYYKFINQQQYCHIGMNWGLRLTLRLTTIVVNEIVLIIRKNTEQIEIRRNILEQKIKCFNLYMGISNMSNVTVLQI